MADVKFKKGLEADLPSTKEEGVFYVSTDTGSIHLDVDNETRIEINASTHRELFDAVAGKSQVQLVTWEADD